MGHASLGEPPSLLSIITESEEGEPHGFIPPPPMQLDHRDIQGGAFWQRIPAYQHVARDTFLDWKWQAQHSVRSVGELRAALGEQLPTSIVADIEAGIASAPMSVRITPYVLARIDWSAFESDPIRRQFLPLSSQRKAEHPATRLDALNERSCSPVRGVTHRYPDRVLFVALDTCPVYCRFCTRSYAIGMDTAAVHKDKPGPRNQRWAHALDYIASNTNVEDVVFSGGDLFMLKGSDLRELGERLLRVPHLRRLRLATKGLAVMPMKLLSDSEWFDALAHLAMLGRELGKEVCMHTHIAHPDEITDITAEAARRVWDLGVTVRNQAVLLRGVNDDVETMIRLIRRLAHLNIHPYYIFQHDFVPGVEDLRTPLHRTISIEKHIRGAIGGFNMPTFVIDLPGGGGKRGVHSYEHYNRQSGISVYRSPVIDASRLFAHFDPLDTLPEDGQAQWAEPGGADVMLREALAAAIDQNPQDMRDA